MEAKKKIKCADIVRIKKGLTVGDEFAGQYGIVVETKNVEYGTGKVFRWLKVELLGDVSFKKIELSENMVDYVCGFEDGGYVDLDAAKPSSKTTPKRTIVIEITDDGAEAKYVRGREIVKTVSIKRHPDDKPNDETAAILATAKLFGHNLRDLEKTADGNLHSYKETLGWLHGAKEALDEVEKRINGLF